MLSVHEKISYNFTSLCLGTGTPFLFLLCLISVPNGFILIVLYRNLLRCFRKAFSVFLVFICAVDLFIGIVVAFGDQRIPQEGDILRILGYIRVNSSILLARAMSVDRFVAVIFPHFYRRKIKRRTLVLCNAAIVVFSSIFASLLFSWYFSRCLSLNRPTFTRHVSSFHNHFGLSGNILLFEEPIASFSSEPTDLVQQHSGSQQATRSNGQKGKEIGYNFLFYFTVSYYFSGPIFCGYHY